MFWKISDLGNTQMEFLFTRFIGAAYLAKYVIDSFLAKQDSLWFQKLGLYVVTTDIRNMQKEINSLLESTCPTNVHNAAVASSLASTHGNDPPNIKVVKMQNKVEEANKLVGLKDETMKIIAQLTGGSRQLNVLSIVGMPGLGKTTLANSVYKHPSVSVNFHVRAWCYLSQVHEKETVLFTILGQILQETYQSYEIRREDIVQKLYQSLKGRRYLIVLDDVWDIEAWHGLKEIFPDDENGSRILFTTQSLSVALKAKSLPFALRLLSTEERYELLSTKLFNGDTCPKELSVISRFIASSCKGLPLAVVVIA
ncbi:hypothetical protein ACH5RR_026725 [Cinchona calisaya]|uniref:NB-ARC domain-containing protein n=1 Tax=Cinchona calisaya TaxID=153742 RepID=A0ABD2Z8D6_9GENT